MLHERVLSYSVVFICRTVKDMSNSLQFGFGQFSKPFWVCWGFYFFFFRHAMLSFQSQKSALPRGTGRRWCGWEGEGVDFSDSVLQGVVGQGAPWMSLILVSVKGLQEKRIVQYLSLKRDQRRLLKDQPSAQSRVT